MRWNGFFNKGLGSMMLPFICTEPRKEKKENISSWTQVATVVWKLNQSLVIHFWLNSMILKLSSSLSDSMILCWTFSCLLFVFKMVLAEVAEKQSFVRSNSKFKKSIMSDLSDSLCTLSWNGAVNNSNQFLFPFFCQCAGNENTVFSCTQV